MVSALNQKELEDLKLTLTHKVSFNSVCSSSIPTMGSHPVRKTEMHLGVTEGECSVPFFAIDNN